MCKQSQETIATSMQGSTSEVRLYSCTTRYYNLRHHVVWVCCLPVDPDKCTARCPGCLQALQVVEQHMLWDAPDIRVTNREDLRLATYIFHQVWDITML
jgi:hypothetical protein